MRTREMCGSDLPILAKLYCACFAEPPWNESFTFDEAVEILERFLEAYAIGIVVESEAGVIGFTGGLPVNERPDILKVVGKKWSNAIYHAEVFVDIDYRQKGAASKLYRMFWREALLRRFDRVVARTSVHQRIVLRMYSPATQLCYQDVPDRRVLLGGDIKKML